MKKTMIAVWAAAASLTLAAGIVEDTKSQPVLAGSAQIAPFGDVTKKVTALGAFTLARGDDVYKVWTGNALTEPENTSMPLAFPGLTTGDIDLVRVIATPGSIPGGGRYEYLSGPDVNKFYTFNHVSATAVYSLRVQLQDKADGIYATRRIIEAAWAQGRQTAFPVCTARRIRQWNFRDARTERETSHCSRSGSQTAVPSRHSMPARFQVK